MLRIRDVDEVGKTEITIDNGLIKFKVYYIDFHNGDTNTGPSYPQVEIPVRLPFSYHGENDNLRESNIQSLNFALDDFSKSNFQIFFEEYGMFPYLGSCNGRKLICEASCVGNLIAQDIILFTLFDIHMKDGGDKEKRIDFLREDCLARLCTLDVYMSSNPASPQALPEFSDFSLRHLFEKGFFQIFDLFCQSEEIKFNLEEDLVQILPIVTQSNVVIDCLAKPVPRFVVLVSVEVFGNITFRSKKIKLDNMDQSDLQYHPEFGSLNYYIGFLNFLPFGCHSHATVDCKGSPIRSKSGQRMSKYYIVFKDSSTCPMCHFESLKIDCTDVQNWIKFYEV